MKNPIFLGLLVFVLVGAVILILTGNPVGLWILGVLLGGALGIGLLRVLDSCAELLRSYRDRKR